MNAFTENSERAFSRQTAELFENYGRGFVRESNFYQKYFVLLLHLKPIIYDHSLAWLALFYITSSLILFFFFLVHKCLCGKYEVCVSCMAVTVVQSDLSFVYSYFLTSCIKKSEANIWHIFYTG